MATFATCPSCESKLRGPDNVSGHKVKCPKCGAMVVLRTHVTPNPPTQQPQPAEPEGPPPLPAKPATVAKAAVVPGLASTQTARVAPQVEDESRGLSRTTLTAMWSFVGVFTLVCVAFLVWHLHSTQQAKTAEANARLSQAVAAANEWIASQSLVDGAALERALADALTDATERQDGASVLKQLRERRAELAEQAGIKAAQLELTAVFQDAKERIESKQVTEAIGLLRQYVANPLATEKVEADRLLAEAETAVADALTLDALVAMNDWAFERAKAAGTIDDGKVTHPVLVSVRAETVQRNLDEATQRRAAIKERQQAEQLAALERQRREEQRKAQEAEQKRAKEWAEDAERKRAAEPFDLKGDRLGMSLDAFKAKYARKVRRPGQEFWLVRRICG